MTFQNFFNYEKGVTRALLKIAEFVEADLNDGLTGRTTKVLDNFMVFRFYSPFLDSSHPLYDCSDKSVWFNYWEKWLQNTRDSRKDWL